MRPPSVPSSFCPRLRRLVSPTEDPARPRVAVSPRISLSLAGILLAASVLIGCDVPTESPSFQVETEVAAPILLNSSFQVLGSSEAGQQVLIDTSRSSWDTLFTAASGDNSVRLVQDVDAFRFGTLDEVVPALSMGETNFSLGTEEFSNGGKTGPGKTGASAVSSAPSQITVTAEGAVSFDLPYVSFESGEDYVELDGGRLLIEELSNSFDVDVTSLVLTFPDLREAPYGEGDGLSVRFEGTTTDAETHTYPALGANSSRDRVAVDLSGMRLMPGGNELDYRIEATADQIPLSGGEIGGTLSADRLSVSRILAVVDPIWVDLTDDADGDGRLELHRDEEAQVTELPGLADLSGVLSSLSVDGAALDLQIGTNVPVGTNFYVGLQGKGGSEHVFLSGSRGLAVSASEADRLDLHGEAGALGPGRLIRFPLPSASTPSKVSSRSIDLNVGPENSNADAVLNSLPSELRLVGQALVNPQGPSRIALARPIELSADLQAQIPIQASGEIVTVSDLREVDFSDLDGLRDTTGGATIQRGALRLLYDNGLPVGAELTAVVLDANEEPIGVRLGSEEEPIVIEAAGTQDGLAVAPVDGEATVELSAEEIDRLHEGRYVDVELTVRAGSSEAVRLQADDRIELALRGSFELRLDAN